MHPSIALQVAELELEREQDPNGHRDDDDEQRWQELILRRPAPFLHFGPRWHQQRRTMTGVLAGYFDLPPRRNEPLPTIPGAHALLARTAAPAITEEELERIELENRKRRKAKAVPKRLKDTVDLSITHDARDSADIIAGVIVAEDPRRRGTGGERLTNRSSTRSRSDSPLTTDFKLVSEESTPPLTPLSSRSDFSLKLHLEEDKDPFTKGTIKSKHVSKHLKRSFHQPSAIKDTVPDDLPSALRKDLADAEGSAKSTSRANVGGGEKKTSASAKTSNPRKRKFSELEKPIQRPRGQAPAAPSNLNPKNPQTQEEQRQKRKTRPGWKGWVEVEGSPEPMTKLINLDAPPLALEKRTRSGKVVPLTAQSLTGPRVSRGRPSIARSSTGAEGSSVPPTESAEGNGEGPLGAINGNTTPLQVDGIAVTSAEV